MRVPIMYSEIRKSREAPGCITLVRAVRDPRERHVGPVQIGISGALEMVTRPTGGLSGPTYVTTSATSASRNDLPIRLRIWSTAVKLSVNEAADAASFGMRRLHR